MNADSIESRTVFVSVYLTLIPDSLKSRKFLRLVMDCSNGRCRCGYVLYLPEAVCEHRYGICTYLREASASLLVQLAGQCESLNEWDEQWV